MTSLQDAHMGLIKLFNSGNVPIVESDYSRPITFNFGEKRHVLSAEVIETNPKNIEAFLVSV